MKKNYIQIVSIILVTLVIGFLLGTQYSQFIIQNKSGDNNNKDIFHKKQECQKYKNEIEIQLEDEDLIISKTGVQTFNSLDEIFYSPKLDSCLYVSTDTMYLYGVRNSEIPSLSDALTGETMLTMIREWGADDYYELSEQFKDAVKGYK